MKLNLNLDLGLDLARRTWLALVFLLSICPLFVEAQISEEQLDQLVNQAMKEFNVAGIAVGVVKDGKVIHAKGYGVSSIKTGQKVDADTQFAIASNTKAFTTTALAILVDQGKLSWQDKVKDHIPEFKMYNAYVTENFTVEDLLTHRSGLGLGVGDLMFFPDGSDFTTKDVLTCFQYFKPATPFRTRFDYDNLLYIVAGEIVARVSGLSWRDFVESKIMKPLDMKRSACSLRGIKDRDNLAVPHSTEVGPMQILNHFGGEDNFTGAAGGIYSSVNDISVWMRMHLNQGKYGKDSSKRLFSANRQREMWRIHTPMPIEYLSNRRRYQSHFYGYGLGWDLYDVKGNLCVSHTGGLPGMLSITTMIPDLNLGIIVLTNTSHGGGFAFDAITNTIVDSYLGLERFAWIDQYKKASKRWLESGDKVTAKVWKTVESNQQKIPNLNVYTGTFEDNWFGKVSISRNKDDLFFRSHRSPKLSGKMYHYKANAFAIKWNQRELNADAFAIFSLDEEGKAVQIKMKGISPNIDFSYDFHDLNLKRVR